VLQRLQCSQMTREMRAINQGSALTATGRSRLWLTSSPLMNLSNESLARLPNKINFNPWRPT